MGSQDLYHGLQTNALLYAEKVISTFNSVEFMFTIYLAITIVAAIAYAVFLLRPYVMTARLHAKELGGLLSQVPNASLDVVGYTTGVLLQGAHAHPPALPQAQPKGPKGA